jgi:hypothetical protein
MSAATLLALVGDEIIMGEAGRIGPIDPQIAKDTSTRGSCEKDYVSSNVIRTAPSVLGDYLKECRNEMKESFGKTIIRPLAEKLDPFLIALSRRHEGTVLSYGKDVLESRGIGAKEAELVIKRLQEFPTHDYVIGRDAIRLGIIGNVLNVRLIEEMGRELEEILDNLLKALMMWESQGESISGPYMIVEGKSLDE